MEEQVHKNTKKQIITTIIVLAVFVLVAALLAKPLLSTVSDYEAFRENIASKGIAGAIVFILLYILQVFCAIIPGGPFEIAAGYAYGIFWGIVVSEISVVLGSTIVFILVRKIGTKFTDYLISFDKLQKVSFIQNTDNLTLVLLLIFLIPGTPKDVITYAAGFTKLPLKNWVFINIVGRLPAIILSVVGGSAFGSGHYTLVIIICVVSIILTGTGAVIYAVIRKKHMQAAESTLETEKSEETK